MEATGSPYRLPAFEVVLLLFKFEEPFRICEVATAEQPLSGALTHKAESIITFTTARLEAQGASSFTSI